MNTQHKEISFPEHKLEQDSRVVLFYASLCSQCLDAFLALVGKLWSGTLKFILKTWAAGAAQLQDSCWMSEAMGTIPSTKKKN